MLDLYHRIATLKPFLPPVKISVCDDPARSLQFAADLVGLNSTVVDLSNVAKFYAESPQTQWAGEDFPNVASPFPVYFYQWNEPNNWLIDGKWMDKSEFGWSQIGIWGSQIDLYKESDRRTFETMMDDRMVRNGGTNSILLLAKDAYDQVAKGWKLFGEKDNFDSLVNKSRFIQMNHYWASNAICQGRPMWLGIVELVFANEVGTFLKRLMLDTIDQDPERIAIINSGTDSVFHVLSLGISFMHCRNVKVSDANFEMSDKWFRRNKVPRVTYKTLVIDPMKEVLQREGSSNTTGIKKALHICRGHFAKYTEENPLFGNFVGTVWRSQHARGSVKEGAVIKDYRVENSAN